MLCDCYVNSYVGGKQDVCVYISNVYMIIDVLSFPNLPNILGNNFSISTSIPARLISESKI